MSLREKRVLHRGFDDYESYIDINEKRLLSILKIHYSQSSIARIIFPSNRILDNNYKVRMPAFVSNSR